MPTNPQCDNRRRTSKEEERYVFEEFAKVCQLPLEIATISSPPEPEPDILVHCQDGSPLSFEMVEVTNLPRRKTTSDSSSIEAQIHQERCALPDDERKEILRRCGGTAINIRFPKELTKPKKMALIPQILDALRGVPPGHDGRLFPFIRRPKEFPHIYIQRDLPLDKDCIEFHVDRATLTKPNLIPMITEKLEKARNGGYTPRAPMEFLGWSSGSLSPCWPEHEVEELLRERLDASGFRRVWLFGLGETGIFFVYPPLESR